MKIKVDQLSKVFKGGHRALDNINLEIGDGMFGLLGPNGAGKTTFMRILVTLAEASSGTITINEMDLSKNRRDIRAMLGYLPQDFRFFSKLKTWEFLDYVASLAGLKDSRKRATAVDEMLESVGLFEVRERLANKLSGGMKRRLGIAQALIGTPKIVIVDEPTTGLDPEERIRFRNILSKMSQKDMVIILSTHIVSDISSICKDMALLNKGKIMYQGSPEALIAQAQNHVWEVNATQNQLEELKEKYSVISTIPSGDMWDVQVVADSVEGFEAQSIAPNLEHAYVYFMKNSTRSL